MLLAPPCRRGILPIMEPSRSERTAKEPELALAGEFPPARRQDWLKLVSAALKGGPLEKLVAKTHDGLTIEPLYSRKPDPQSVPGRALGAAGQILHRVDHPDPGAANEQARHDLENGATG